MQTTPRIGRFVLAAGLAGATLTGLVAGAAGASSLSNRRAASAASIPSGTVLRVGEQLHNLSTVLSLGHENQGFAYQVQYSEFVGGPPMLQAFEGGSLDIGFIQSTPLIFAQAAGQQVTAVAGWASSGSAYGLVTAPGAHSIKSWAGLKGKRVAFQEGTALESALLEGLSSAGLTLHDITPVNLPTTQIAAALQGGSADVGIEVEPLLSAYLQANPTARVIAHPAAVTEKSEFLVAAPGALSNRAVSAAMADYIGRLIKAYAYLATHTQAVIQTTYEGQYGLKPARAQTVAAIIGPSKFFALPGAILGPQQNLANLYVATGAIPSHVSVNKEFDTRFNALVAGGHGS
ncbi:MAG TPA: ABC transporter substrate-binding protein [Acidimicrobiales bacterium]|jgi:sulfonate transport system substrate-binding protein|nr:ABC transporter substrate-binding protein [Acidimicrobiales bacterium]